jgi:hypothetical protein
MEAEALLSCQCERDCGCPGAGPICSLCEHGPAVAAALDAARSGEERLRERIKAAADGHRDLAQAARKAGERDDAMLHAHMAAAVRELLSESEEG